MTHTTPSSTHIVFPESIVCGYSYRPNERWNFELNIDWTHWDRVDSLDLRGIHGANYVLNWKNAFIWEFGATRYWTNGWHLSAGYTFVENAVPDENLLPVVPDHDRHFFAIGLGRNSGNFSGKPPTSTLTPGSAR